VYWSLQAYCTYPMRVQYSHFHRQEAPRHNDAGDPSSERWNLLGDKRPVIWPKVASSTLLYGPFTCRKSTTWDRRFYFPSEGSRAEDFFALKIRRLRPGLNPRTWVLKASTQLLDHRSRWRGDYCAKSSLV
jgi:hypothetical protein